MQDISTIQNGTDTLDCALIIKDKIIYHVFIFVCRMLSTMQRQRKMGSFYQTKVIIVKKEF